MVGHQRITQGLGTALDLEAARQHALSRTAALHAVLHHIPDTQQAGVDLGIAGPDVLQAHFVAVGVHGLCAQRVDDRRQRQGPQTLGVLLGAWRLGLLKRFRNRS